MRITPDTNILVRILTEDDLDQSRRAQEVPAAADRVMITLPALWEFVWVLARSYRLDGPVIAEALRRLSEGKAVVLNRSALEAGLTMLEEGGDFADGVIAHEGARLGADAFVSFDRAAVRRLGARGLAAQLL